MAANQAGGASSPTVSQEALEMAKKQATLRYQVSRNRESYLMMSPYFILFFFFTVLPVAMLSSATALSSWTRSRLMPVSLRNT